MTVPFMIPSKPRRSSTPSYGAGFETLAGRAKPGAFKAWYDRTTLTGAIGSAGD